MFTRSISPEAKRLSLLTAKTTQKYTLYTHLIFSTHAHLMMAD